MEYVAKMVGLRMYLLHLKKYTGMYIAARRTGVRRG